MKGIIIIISTLILYSCSITSEFNTSLARKNMSLVKVTDNNAFDSQPFYYNEKIYIDSAYPNSTYYFGTSLQKINGIGTSHLIKSYKITEGKNELLVGCQITSGLSNVFSYIDINNSHLLNVNLKKGHTYVLIPVMVKDIKNKNNSCKVELNDTTII